MAAMASVNRLWIISMSRASGWRGAGATHQMTIIINELKI